MKLSLDCIPCLLGQTLRAARMISDDPRVHSDTMRELLLLVANTDLSESPVTVAQYIHRYLRETTGSDDPYKGPKEQHNRIVQQLLPELRTLVQTAKDPLEMAVRLAIAGNTIDMGPNSTIAERDIREAITQALGKPLGGELEEFRQALETADTILYLADNAGEIVFDRILIEQLDIEKTTVAVRGEPVLNDATRADARTTGLDAIVRVIDNGSDAPGTILTDCNEAFRDSFLRADVVIAKGQGNYESLSDEARDIFFLFKVKCDLVASHIGLPMGSHVLARSPKCCTVTS